MAQDPQTHRIQKVQRALAQQGLLHGEYESGRVNRATFDALLAREKTVLEATAVASSIVNEVDFPSFVSDLINGVFEANVDAAVKQMGSYVDLLRQGVAGRCNPCKSDGESGQ